MTPRDILKLPPCMDLDKYVLDKVLEGPVEAIQEFGVSIPSFSNNTGHCYPILVMLAVNGEPLNIVLDDAYFNIALRSEQVVRKNECKVWRVSNNKYVGFGRTFAEAVCKLAICVKFDIKPLEPRKDGDLKI